MPKWLKEDLENDSYYKKCCITGMSDEKIDFHHNLIFAGKQINEKWCILPLLQSIHREIVKYKEKCNWIMLNRATNKDLEKYSKVVDYKRERERLNKIYGVYPKRKSKINTTHI